MASSPHVPSHPADTVQVERLGGFAGFGLPGSALRSRGQLAWDQLNPQAQAQLAAWFNQPPHAPAVGNDDFRYRLTRQTAAGVQVLELPEALVPAPLRDCVHDELV